MAASELNSLDLTSYFLLPKCTIAHMLKLPCIGEHDAKEWILRFGYHDRCLHRVLIRLTDLRLPEPQTHQLNGFTIVTTVGTEIDLFGQEQFGCDAAKKFLTRTLCDFEISRETINCWYWDEDLRSTGL